MGSWGDECCLSCVLTRKGEVKMAQEGFKPPNPASSRAAFKKKLFEKKSSWGNKESGWKITRLPWTFLLGPVKKFTGTSSKLWWKNPNELFGQSKTMWTFYESMISVWKTMIGDISINSVPSRHVIHASDCMRKMWSPESFYSSQLMHIVCACAELLSRSVVSDSLHVLLLSL